MRIAHEHDPESYRDIVPPPEPSPRGDFVLWSLMIICILAIAALGTSYLWVPLLNAWW